MDRDIIISGVNLDLTEALKQIVTEKDEKLYRRDECIIRISLRSWARND